jgi:hypothetical protein
MINSRFLQFTLTVKPAEFLECIIEILKKLKLYSCTNLKEITRQPSKPTQKITRRNWQSMKYYIGHKALAVSPNKIY